MRRLRYSVAASLDGHIAGPNGELDWIATDPTVDFAALVAGVDTVLMRQLGVNCLASWLPGLILAPGV
ncbi:MAG: hypothetical protein ABR589_06940 [Chthoniobacterales bacterium]